MSRVSRLLALGVVAYATTVLFAACGGRSETPAESLLPPSAQTAPVRALMAAVIDPAADVVWESVATIITGPPNVIEERAPKNDEEWAEVRRNALIVMEASDLLTTPGRPIAGPGEKSIAPGVELEPSEIAAMVAKDQERWDQQARDLREATAAMLQAIDARDPDMMFDLGDDLDATCENCHITFWYPGQILPPGYEEPEPRKN